MKIINRNNINFINGDCIKFMKTKPDNYYDLAIVDPPYGIGAGSVSFKSGTRKKSTIHRQTDWDNAIPLIEYWEQLFRVSKNQIVWGGNYMTEHLKPSKCWVVWNKKTGDNSYGDGELAWTSFDKTIKIYDKYWSGANAKEKNQIDRIHPTQKPVNLYRYLLQTFADKGMKILDTHGGSFSNAIACDMEGFYLDICEIDAEYFKNGLNEFDMYKSQLKLF